MATVVTSTRGDQRAMSRAASLVAERRAERDQRKQHARHGRDAIAGDAQLLDEQRQDRTEAAIDGLQREDHRQGEQKARRRRQLAQDRHQAARRLPRVQRTRGSR